MNKENWINEVMGSLDDLKSAEANPFLYTRILARMESREKNYAPARLIWLAAASFIVLVALNVILIKGSGNHAEQTSDTEVEQFFEAYQLNNFSYN